MKLAALHAALVAVGFAAGVAVSARTHRAWRRIRRPVLLEELRVAIGYGRGSVAQWERVVATLRQARLL